jgi:hypothetical protein
LSLRKLGVGVVEAIHILRERWSMPTMTSNYYHGVSYVSE